MNSSSPISRSEAVAEASEDMHVEADVDISTFQRLLVTTLAAASDKDRFLVNVIDPSSTLTLCHIEELKTLLFSQKTPETPCLAAVDLSTCANQERLAEEMIIQLTGFLKNGRGALAKELNKIRPDLSPWSPSTAQELKLRLDNLKSSSEDTKWVAVVRGIESLPASSEMHATAMARWTAGCFRIPVMFIVSEQPYHHCDLKLRWPIPARAEFQRDTEHLIRSIAIQMRATPEAPSEPCTTAKRVYWYTLSSRIFPTVRTHESSVTGEEPLAQGENDPFQQNVQSVAALIANATYPSRRMRSQAIIGLRVRAEAIRARGEPTRSRAVDEQKETGDTSPDAIAAARMAAQEVAPQVIFLSLLDIAFPEIMQAAYSEANGYHELFRLQLHIVSDGGRTETVAFGTKWLLFSQDARVRSFFSFAMGKDGDGTRRVLPFASATAIKRHSYLLSSAATDPLRALLSELMLACKEIALKAEEIRKDRPRLTREANDAKANLSDAHEKLRFAVEAARKVDDCRVRMSGPWSRALTGWDRLSQTDRQLHGTAVRNGDGNFETLKAAALEVLAELDAAYKAIREAADAVPKGEKDVERLAADAGDARTACERLSSSYKGMKMVGEKSTTGKETWAITGTADARAACGQLDTAHNTLKAAVDKVQSGLDRSARILTAADLVDAAQQKYETAESERAKNEEIFTPSLPIENYFRRAQDLWQQDGRQELEPGDVIENALRRLAFLEMVGNPRDLQSTEAPGPFASEWGKEVNACLHDLREARDATQGALELDARLGIARGCALRREYDAADEELGIRLSADDELGTLAVALGAGFVSECRGKVAITEYERIALEAERIGARELSARAIYGVERCRLSQKQKASWQPVSRAELFLSVQLARSPFVGRRWSKDRQRVFVSYRGKQKEFVDRLKTALQTYESRRSDGGGFDVWIDLDAIDNVRSEFRPEIQLGLDHSDGFLIVLSPDYFESHYCTWELATALAKRRLNGQPVGWICVNEAVVPGVHARDQVTGWLTKSGSSVVNLSLESQVKLVISEKPLHDFVLDHNVSGAVLGEIALALEAMLDGPARSDHRSV